MTTTVTVLIQGNKACEVKVSRYACPDNQITTVMPGAFTEKFIHGEEYITVTEVGEFLS